VTLTPIEEDEINLGDPPSRIKERKKKKMNHLLNEYACVKFY
jgi:hypothetical protein